MQINKLIIPLLSIACISVTACGDDNEPVISDNAITLNMMLDNSQTTIGGSDVYINTAKNFTSSNCVIVDLGSKGNFQLNPNLTQVAQDVAVTPGNYYQIIPARDIKNVAGQRAFPVNTSYYSVYADSWIFNNDDEINGAKIIYAECFPNTRYIPEWDANIELTLKSDKYAETGSYSFDKNAHIDPYFSVYDVGSSNFKSHLDIEVQGNTFTFSNVAYTPGGKVEIVALIRHESLYTRVHLTVNSSI